MVTNAVKLRFFYVTREELSFYTLIRFVKNERKRFALLVSSSLFFSQSEALSV